MKDLPILFQSESNAVSGLPFYPIEAIGVDMFPNTEHGELVVTMARCGKTDADEEERLAQLDAAAAEERRKRQEAREAMVAAANKSSSQN